MGNELIRPYFKLTVVDEGVEKTSVESRTEDGVRSALGDRLSDLTFEQGMQITPAAKVYVESGQKIGPFYLNVVDHGSHPLESIPPKP